jgi:hypothetical protein
MKSPSSPLFLIFRHYFLPFLSPPPFTLTFLSMGNFEMLSKSNGHPKEPAPSQPERRNERPDVDETGLLEERVNGSPPTTSAPAPPPHDGGYPPEVRNTSPSERMLGEWLRVGVGQTDDGVARLALRRLRFPP